MRDNFRQVSLKYMVSTRGGVGNGQGGRAQLGDENNEWLSSDDLQLIQETLIGPMQLMS